MAMNKLQLEAFEAERKQTLHIGNFTIWSN